MPVEGLITEGSTQGDGKTATASTSDATDKNTGATQTGAATQTAQQTAANNVDVTQTPEFKDALTKAIEAKIPQLKRALAKSITGEQDKDGEPSVAELQRQLSEERTARQSSEARDAIDEYVTDARHKLNVPSENLRPIRELVISRLEYDSTGKPSNIKEAIESVKSLAPTLFANQPSNINAGAGRTSPTPTNMNEMIRQQAGFGN